MSMIDDPWGKRLVYTANDFYRVYGNKLARLGQLW